MTPAPHLRFGPKSPETLILAFRGGRPQSVEGGWVSWIIEPFRPMSKLEFLAAEGTPSIGRKVATYDSLHEWVRSITMRFIGADRNKLVYVDATGAVVHIDKGDKAKFPVIAHEADVRSGGVAVVMPDMDLSIYGQSGVDEVERILDAEKPNKAYFFGFSRNASAFVETISKHIQFDGAVICCGVDPPTERDSTPRKPIKSIVIYGSKEKPGLFGLRSNKETAAEIHKVFSQVGECSLWEHDLAGGWLLPGHTWPAYYNDSIASYFGIAKG